MRPFTICTVAARCLLEADVHWLHAYERIKFKLAVLICWALHSTPVSLWRAVLCHWYRWEVVSDCHAALLLVTVHLPQDLEWSVSRCHVCHVFTHTHTRLTALFPGLPRWAGTRKVKPIWILLEQEAVSGSGISWAICKSASCSRQITTPAPHHSVFYRSDALPAAQPTASKHWRQRLYSHFSENWNHIYFDSLTPRTLFFDLLCHSP